MFSVAAGESPAHSGTPGASHAADESETLARRTGVWSSVEGCDATARYHGPLMKEPKPLYHGVSARYHRRPCPSLTVAHRLQQLQLLLPPPCLPSDAQV